MGKFASGKNALAISDRSGLQFPYNEMVKEWTAGALQISVGNPFYSKAAATTVVYVIEPNHGRSTGDRVRFRNCQTGGGFTQTVLENAFGYLITVPTDSPDEYHFTASSGGSESANVRFGGSICTSGPVNIEG